MSDDKRRGVDGEMVGDDVYPPASTTWVGAFERVMGDQTDQSDFSSPSKSRSRSYRRQTTSVAAPSSDSSEPSLPNRSAAPSPFKPSSETDQTHSKSRSRSDSVSGNTNPTQKANTSENGSLARPAYSRKQSSHLGTRKKKSAQGPALVTVSQTDSIDLKDVYWNHAPSLLPIHVQNVSGNDRVLLRLRSDVGRALTFLKRKKAGQNPKEPIVYPTNTAAWAEAGGLHPSKLREIRHLVANLETSDSLILEAGTGEDVFLSFRPAEVEQSLAAITPRSPTPDHSKHSPSMPDATTEQSQTSSSSSEMALSPRPNAESLLAAPSLDSSLPYQLLEAHGLVSFRASSLPLLDAPVELDAAGARDPISSSGSNISSSSSSRPASWLGSHLSSTTTAVTDVSAADGSVQQIDLPFTATYCRPQLGASKAHGRGKVQQQGVITLDFGDLFVGQEQEMDVAVYNQSAIDLYCQVRLDDADNALQKVPLVLLDDAGKIVPTFTSADDHPYEPQYFTANSMKKVRLSLKPTEPCRDYEQTVTFINMHDAGNSIRMLVRANILGEARDDALAVLSGDVIDFGDCAGGHWTRQLLVLRNNCEQYLDVHFNSEKGVEVNFQLAEMAQRNNEEESLALQDVPPDAPASSMSAASDSGGSEHARSSTSGAGLSSPSHSDSPLPSDEDLKQSASTQEFAKTPLAKPQQATASDEPPFFALPGQDEGKRCEVLQLTAKGGDDNEDDVDASSVASQAGSMPGSPRIGPSQISKGMVLEPDQSSATASRHNSTYFNDAASSEGGRSGQTTSDVFSSGPVSRTAAMMHRIRSETQSVEDKSSTRSDVTTMSHDSRLGPFLSAASSHHGGSTTSHSDRMRSARHGGTVALSGLRNVEQAHGNQLEELILRPGAEYRVIVSHRPSRGQVDTGYTAGKLVEKSFRLLLDYAKSKSPGVRSRGGRTRKNVLCRIRTCTSFISVSPKLIDYGAANVGTKKTANFAVTNHSELTARVDLRYVSKVLSMYRDEISIPPLQSLELRVDFFPRRVNDSYRKQVTVANLLNRHNDEILEVRSKNVDEQKVSFHSLFYRILTSTGSNYLDFGDVNINCTRVRSFNIENISKGKLTLELSAAHSEDLRLYVKAGQQSSPMQGKDRDKVPNRYAELEAAENGAAIVDNDEGRGKTTVGSRGGLSRANGLDLKERFLESMNQEMPAIIRKENTSWRTAQKDSHYRKGTKAKAGQKKGDAGGEKKETTKKAPINLVSALKKGGKGRLTQKYGKSITFKDLKLLSESEYLDLATGPPIDGKRIPVKSRRYQLLHDLETGKAAAKSEGKGKGATEAALSNNGEGMKKKNSQGHLRHKSSLVAQSSALADRPKTEAALHDANDVSKLSVDELITAVEAQGSSLSTFFLGNPEAEEQSVRTEINLQRELQSAISNRRLQAIETLSIEAGQEQQVIAIYTPNGSTRPHIQGNARKQDSRIFLRLIEFETKGVEDIDDFEHMSKLDVDELPVRELMVKSNICRSLLELSQPHINFGQMDKGETKTRKILIQNRSEWALRFCIRKSGNISSGDIKLKSSDRYGVVPGHGKREVEFVFCPTLTGAFQERLTVENVADRDKDETVFLKANVRKVSNFRVEPSIVSFDAGDEGDGSDVLSMGSVSTQEQSFIVSNVSTKTRTFVVGVDGEELQFTTFSVDVLLNASSQGMTKASLSREEEEEVEHISQKLKIASRKGQEDKMKKYSDRLIELGVASQTSSPQMNSKATLPGGGGEDEVAAAAAAAGDAAEAEKPKKAENDSNSNGTKLKQVSSTVTLTLPPNQSKTLLIRLRPSVKSHSQHGALSADSAWRHDSGQFSINVRVHEQKNTDEVQTVEVRGRVQASNGGNSAPRQSERDTTLDDLRQEGWIVFSAPPSTVAS